MRIFGYTWTVKRLIYNWKMIDMYVIWKKICYVWWEGFKKKEKIKENWIYNVEEKLLLFLMKYTWEEISMQFMKKNDSEEKV